MRTRILLVGTVFLIVGFHARAGDFNIVGDMSVASNFSARSMNVTSPSGTTNKVSIGSAGNVVASTLWATNFFGIGLNSSNAIPFIQFVCNNGEGGGFSFDSRNLGHLGGLWVRSEDQWLQCNLPGFRSEGPIESYSDLTIDGKLTTGGSIDPPFMLLDAETRAGIARRVAREVAPSKQNGAAVFWNNETKRLEIYVASEGAFYNLSGNLITNIVPPSIAGVAVSQRFAIDPDTGQVITKQSQQAPRWQLKAGYGFDRTTGHFTYQDGPNAAPVPVTREEAIELR